MSRAVVRLSVKEAADEDRAGLMSRLVLAAVVTAAVSAVSLGPFWTLNPVTGTTNLLVAASFMVTGVALAETPGHRLTARLLVATAGFWLLSWWWAWPPEWQVGPVALLSNVCGYLWFVCGGIALLRYPDGHLANRFESGYFVLLGAWVVVGKLAIAAVGRPEWGGYSLGSWWPTLAPDRALYDVGNAVFYAGVVTLAVTMLALLVAKLSRSRGVDRLDALPVLVAACTVTLSGGIYLSARLFSFSPQVIGALQTCMGVAALVTPLAFLMAVLRRRLAHLAVADLVVRVAGAATPQDVETELRRVLDTTLELWIWDASARSYVNMEGSVGALPGAAGRWEHRVEASDGNHLAVVYLDQSLRRVPYLVRSVLVAAGLALEVQAQLAEVTASRGRIVAAADAERRRIERDLHDGVQQALLAVAAQLSTARIQAQDNGDAVGSIDGARHVLSDALSEMRRLARGIHPALLSGSGLLVALEDVADRLPLDITLHVPKQRVSAEVELALYFITCEALTNVVRHSTAAAATVVVSHAPGRAEVEITDEGTGGADMAGGSGLAGMRDRAEALGGSFTVDSRTAVGTTIRAVVPCG